jgi:hypothetical protein
LCFRTGKPINVHKAVALSLALILKDEAGRVVESDEADGLGFRSNAGCLRRPIMYRGSSLSESGRTS